MWRGAAARASAGALVLLLCATAVSCCGPGRGGARRRSTRKLMPLIFKEHVPNVYENTLGASGLSEGPITRDSSRFQNLVPNYNPDILFRDEEGTGADRLMTERCKERLDTLAISVMNQWPGVRLRVKDAWEEDDTRHSPQSLHYEGRAVDLATSDSDRSKYGMLGRLAVEAGFDWVYYEARSHVHCSVKSESPAMNRLGGCFPGASFVFTPNGRRLVSNIREDDVVAVMDDVTGTVRFSPVILMLHANSNMRAHFLHLRTESGREIRITASHLLMAALTTKGETIRAVYAGQINLGDHLLVQKDSSEPSDSVSTHHYSATNKSGLLVLEKVVSVSSMLARGVYAPLTAEGNLIIDGVVVSCYAVIDSQALAHLSFLPVRLFYRIKRFLVLTFESMGLISIANKLETEILTERNNSTSELFLTKLNVTERRKLNDTEEQNVLYNKNKRTITSEDVLTETEESSIHWYPRILYALAKLILPRWLIVS